jgi:hypothetical protein
MTETLPPDEARGPVEPKKSRKRGSEKLEALIRKLELDPIQEAYVDERWLGQVEWLSNKARENQRKYKGWRVTGLVIGLLVPALIVVTSPTVADAADFLPVPWLRGLRGLTIALSLVVSICAAIEQFFNYGERWRHYRRTSELLKIEGWSFITLADPYKKDGSHKRAFAKFADRVERILKTDLDDYIQRITQETARTGGTGQ